jgi:acetyl-CoA carboxylase biotin carboxyl carrier protein
VLAHPPEGIAVDLRYEDVVEILRLIDESTAREIELAYGDLKLVVRKGHGAAAEPAGAAAHATSAPPPTRAQPPAAVAPANGAAQPPAEAPTPPAATATVPPARDGLVPVTAPMVGTFYRAPAPGAPPFVEVGSAVAVDQPLCIIEVMKVLNTLKSPVAGVVEEICVPNAGLIEYGQVLMWIAPVEAPVQ